MTTVDVESWIAHPRCLNQSDETRKLIARRSEIEVIGEVSDAEADYSFDDYALIRLDSDYYLLNTSGWLCPSPDEEWGIAFGPCSLSDMRTHITSFNNVGVYRYGVTKRQFAEFIAMVDEAEKRVS
jgi:hypothetical protein